MWAYPPARLGRVPCGHARDSRPRAPSGPAPVPLLFSCVARLLHIWRGVLVVRQDTYVVPATKRAYASWCVSWWPCGSPCRMAIGGRSVLAVFPPPKQRQLALLGIEAHERPDNCFLHQYLVFRLPSIELPARDPRGIALLAQR